MATSRRFDSAECPLWVKGGHCAVSEQPFQLDEESARSTIGWHTAAVTMRLLVDSECLLCANSGLRPCQSDQDLLRRYLQRTVSA